MILRHWRGNSKKAGILNARGPARSLCGNRAMAGPGGQRLAHGAKDVRDMPLIIRRKSRFFRSDLTEIKGNPDESAQYQRQRSQTGVAPGVLRETPVAGADGVIGIGLPVLFARFLGRPVPFSFSAPLLTFSPVCRIGSLATLTKGNLWAVPVRAHRSRRRFGLEWRCRAGGVRQETYIGDA